MHIPYRYNHMALEMRNLININDSLLIKITRMCKNHYTECSKYKTPIRHTHLDKLNLCFCSQLFLSKFMKKLKF